MLPTITGTNQNSPILNAHLRRAVILPDSINCSNSFSLTRAGTDDKWTALILRNIEQSLPSMQRKPAEMRAEMNRQRAGRVQPDCRTVTQSDIAPFSHCRVIGCQERRHRCD
ncbi:hypothetical protein GLI01_35680 [Gluconacetobacter liquefaciens]|nr:hypothetical protein AA0522_1752 [Gluconacetobacter liquefaciens NRIC 0522]GEB39533.1 hypothetical protein GLI01_35680 [Gluconacetobacter liquefaciens]